ncbi:G-type lectin S-receptor-like serine/threonine-protein kinase At4g03230 [Bidens hawaiensis]|uniref:G-type lectin S-receptor-like serine/threonine-protein kinase At4g03230 n=1 Tax=Bidens hawaiensis TaxID=980011 RepID=UPI00404A18A9
MENDIDKNVDLAVFDLSTVVVVVATDNFSPINKLGEMDLASFTSSSQGMQEFKNKVMLIAKLQHRNLDLVWLLGYRFQKDEKMLVYKHLPNKGLDSFIFGFLLFSNLQLKTDPNQGIVRGLLYLHHDSRLRIIHVDLKASNVLQDTDLNPKISDFGLAKIFEGDEDEARTRTVVGTYGYMSPKYAMEDLFSIRYDVFSFGVLVMEITGGRKSI